MQYLVNKFLYHGQLDDEAGHYAIWWFFISVLMKTMCSLADTASADYPQRAQRRTWLDYSNAYADLVFRWAHIGRVMRKRAFGHMRIAKAQISLRICAVWPGP